MHHFTPVGAYLSGLRRISARTLTRSVFTRQEDGVICEPQCDAFEGEVREWDFLDVDDVVTSILAGQISRQVGIYVQFPYLESLGPDAFIVKLRERNLVEQPIGAYAQWRKTEGEITMASPSNSRSGGCPELIYGPSSL